MRRLLIILLLTSSLFGAEYDKALAKVMAGRVGTAVVVNVASGRILGAYRLDTAEWKLARPGSTFKPFTLLALLESGQLNANDTFTCRRNLHVGEHNLSCSHPQTGQPLDAVSALAYSCNDFFATMGARLTAGQIQQIFRYYGFGSPSSLVAQEATGTIKPATTDEERQLQAIGEGDMRVTPLEMLAAYRKIATQRFERQASEPMKVIFAGLEASTDYGMARLASIKGLKVAGKTGTARTDQGTWSNAWFAGYAPANNPEIALVVFLEKGTGPGDAAPLAAEIFEALFHRGKH